MVDDALGGFGHDFGRDQPDDEQESQGNEGILEIFFVGPVVDGVDKWDRGDLRGFLVDGCLKQVVGSVIGFILKLKEIEQTVFDFGEVGADDARGLFVGDALPEMVDFEDGGEDVANEDKDGCKDVEPKKTGAQSCAEIAEMLEDHHQQKKRN